MVSLFLYFSNSVFINISLFLDLKFCAVCLYFAILLMFNLNFFYNIDELKSVYTSMYGIEATVWDNSQKLVTNCSIERTTIVRSILLVYSAHIYFSI